MGFRGSWYSSWVTRSCKKASWPSDEVEEELVELVEFDALDEPNRLLT